MAAGISCLLMSLAFVCLLSRRDLRSPPSPLSQT
ncbi:hypothetical protein CBM2586_B130011 [Cupriavidus phytorum]|uniref:Uncharacterized protein n=1 Tax=Cupriavidus taiwanensis TaxID=164546 RepID=A0A375CHA5_9BURK|nr:hypothetical protein CBM2586_B130011 [Cupriavidus taiwanensis]